MPSYVRMKVRVARHFRLKTCLNPLYSCLLVHLVNSCSCSSRICTDCRNRSLLLSEIFYRLYFLVKVRRKTRKLKRVDAENNTGAMQGSGPGSGAHTIAEPDPSPPDNVIEQGGWPNVELRLQDSSPSSPLPLTEADIPMGLFSVSTNHPRTDGVGESQLESELSDVL